MQVALEMVDFIGQRGDGNGFRYAVVRKVR